MGPAYPAVECSSSAFNFFLTILGTLVEFQRVAWPVPSCKQYNKGLVPPRRQVDKTRVESPLMLCGGGSRGKRHGWLCMFRHEPCEGPRRTCRHQPGNRWKGPFPAGKAGGTRHWDSSYPCNASVKTQPDKSCATKGQHKCK